MRIETMLDWNDLRCVLAIARARNVADAASELDVHQSTVFRRLNALEKELGVRLFERLPTGYLATAAGAEICQAAERIEKDIATLDRQISGQDLRPSGTVRVTTTDTLLQLLTPSFAAFRAAYPQIELEVIVSNQFFNLTKRDADVAIRPSSNPPETLVGRRIASVATAIYGSKAYLAKQTAAVNDLSKHSWIGTDESLSHLASARWLAKLLPNVSIPYRTNTLMGMLEAAKQDLGLAALPCFIADLDPELERVHPPLPELATDLWVLTHEDIRNVARLSAFIDFVASSLKPQVDLFEGKDRSSAIAKAYDT